MSNTQISSAPDLKSMATFVSGAFGNAVCYSHEMQHILEQMYKEEGEAIYSDAKLIEEGAKFAAKSTIAEGHDTAQATRTQGWAMAAGGAISAGIGLAGPFFNKKFSGTGKKLETATTNFNRAQELKQALNEVREEQNGELEAGSNPKQIDPQVAALKDKFTKEDPSRNPDFFEEHKEGIIDKTLVTKIRETGFTNSKGEQVPATKSILSSLNPEEIKAMEEQMNFSQKETAKNNAEQAYNLSNQKIQGFAQAATTLGQGVGSGFAAQNQEEAAKDRAEAQVSNTLNQGGNTAQSISTQARASLDQAWIDSINLYASLARAV